MRFRKTLAVLSLLAFLVLLPGGGALEALPEACPDNAPVSLYLSDGNKLTGMLGGEGSTPFPAQAKVSVALAWLVGTWSTQPVAAPVDFTGNVNFSIWARGAGLAQLSTRFQVYFGSNGARTGSAYSTGSGRLGSTPSEFTGTAAGVSIRLNPGDTLDLFIYVSERGSGGSVVYGGSCPSGMSLALKPLTLNLTVESRPGELRVTGNATDLWGRQEIFGLSLSILGPMSRSDDLGCGRDLVANKTHLVKTVTMDKLAVEDVSDSEIGFTYSWKFDASTVAPGLYAAVAIIDTLSNATLDNLATAGVQRSGGGFSLGGATLLVGGALAILMGIGGVTVFYFYRSGRSLRAFAKNRKAVAAVGAALLLVVVSLGLYLSLGTVPAGTEKAPGFNLKDVDGKPVSLEMYRGSVVVLDMMATWCPTCNQEIPELKDFKGKHPEVVVISIDVDKTESAGKLKDHMRSKGANWIYCMDTDNILQKYKASEIPKIVVIDPSGYVTFIRAGLVSSGELSQEAQKARSGSAPILSLGGETGFAVLAFLAGISAFFSPCAFPLLPGYMTYYLGRESKEAANRKAAIRKALIGGVAAAAGVLIIYALMGLLVAGAGEAVKSYAGYLAPVVAAIILVMGLIMLTDYVLPVYRITALLNPLVERARKGMSRLASGKEGAEPGQYVGLLGYGAGYGAASLGCHAPIFIAVVMAGLVAGGVGSALLAFVMYAVGMGLFLVLVTVMVGMAKTALVKRMQQWMPLIKKVSGLVLMIVGAVLIYNFYLTMG